MLITYTHRAAYKEAYRDVRLAMFRGQHVTRTWKNGESKVGKPIPLVALGLNPYNDLAFESYQNRTSPKMKSNRYRSAMLVKHDIEKDNFIWRIDATDKEILGKIKELRERK